MNKLQTLALAALLLSGGCTMAPQYNRPKDPVPAEWPQRDAYKELQADAIQKVAGIPWQKFFTDAKLRKVVADLSLDKKMLQDVLSKKL